MAEKNESKALGQRLSMALEGAKPKLSRAALARRLKVTPGAVTHWLNGERRCPADTVRRIAEITRTDIGWLMTGNQAIERSESMTVPSKATPLDLPVTLSWGFRETPPDDGKDFGNAAVYATPQTVRTLVRENGQNSLDANRGQQVTIRFRIIELSSRSERYRRFLDAMSYDKLDEHLESVSKSAFDTKLITKLSAGRERIVRKQRLVLVVTEDFGTIGLHGGETESNNPFAALVRDNLNSQKSQRTAGGIFGVGAKVNFACSSLGTVVFASKVAGQEDQGTRLIAKAELTYHDHPDKRPCSGPGWLGKNADVGKTHSVWVQDQDSLLDDLMLKRFPLPKGVTEDEATGTSIMVVGFLDPEIEPGESTARLVDRFAKAAAENFWPAMIRGQLAVWVERYVDDDNDPVAQVKVNPATYVGAFADAYEKFLRGDAKSALREFGDVVTVPVALTTPATKSGAKGIDDFPETSAECRLIVRLAEPERAEHDEHVNQVGFARGRAMIVRYVTKNGVVVGAPPFHAVLLAGTLAGAGPEHVPVEQFLRLAEPPAHNRWEYNEDLGEKYARGAGARINDFFKAVTEALQNTLLTRNPDEQAGPEILRRLLQISAPPPPPPVQLKLQNVEDRLENGAWHIEADISINPTPNVLEITPTLSFVREGGAGIKAKWAVLELLDGPAEQRDQTFVVKPRTKRLRFRGVSDPATHPVEATRAVADVDLQTKERTEP